MARSAVWRTIRFGLIGAIGLTGQTLAEDLPPLVPPNETPASQPSSPPVIESRPVLEPPVSARETTSRSTTPAAEPEANRPVLALPGLTAPSSRTPRLGRPADPAPASLTPDQADALPPLLAPIDRTQRSTNPEPISSQPLSSQRFRPRIVESVPRQTVEPKEKATSRSMLPLEPGPRDLARPSDVRSLPGPRAYDEATNNRSRILNLFNPPRGSGEPESSISTEPRPDPAADAALKRRIEKQAAQSVGSRAKEIEVRVVGRIVTIQAKGVRFLQKRAVKKSLESLPALSGYKAVIDVRD